MRKRKREKESALTVVRGKGLPARGNRRWSGGPSLREEERCSTDSSAVPLWFTLRELPLRPSPTRRERSKRHTKNKREGFTNPRELNREGEGEKDKERAGVAGASETEEASGKPTESPARDTMTFEQAGSRMVSSPRTRYPRRGSGDVIRTPRAFLREKRFISRWRIIERWWTTFKGLINRCLLKGISQIVSRKINRSEDVTRVHTLARAYKLNVCAFFVCNVKIARPSMRVSYGFQQPRENDGGRRTRKQSLASETSRPQLGRARRRGWRFIDLPGYRSDILPSAIRLICAVRRLANAPGKQ